MGRLTTIGYEKVELKEFIKTLSKEGISILIDIRDFPVSRRKGFSKSALADAVEAAGIAYQHIRPLGNPPEGRDAARAGRTAEFHRIFRSRLKTADAQAGLRTIADLTQKHSICLMCYERDYVECHRSIVAAEVAARIRRPVTHLTAPVSA